MLILFKNRILKQHKNENLIYINNTINLMFKLMKIPVYAIKKFYIINFIELMIFKMIKYPD